MSISQLSADGVGGVGIRHLYGDPGAVIEVYSPRSTYCAYGNSEGGR